MANYENLYIQLLVPLHYRRGGNVDTLSYSNLYDGDVNTTKTLAASDTGAQWTLAESGYPRWMFLHAQTPGSAGYFNIKFDGSTQSIANIYNDRGTSFWTVGSGTNLQRTATEYTAESNLLVDTGATAAFTQVRLETSSVSTVPTIRGLVFSEHYRVPMYNLGYDVECSFPGADRTPHGLELTNFAVVKNQQMQTKWSFSWSGLTIDERNVFDDFLDAFGGNIRQPFVMAIIHGDITAAMTARNFLIEDGSVEITGDKNGEYGVSFSCLELIRDYNINETAFALTGLETSLSLWLDASVIPDLVDGDAVTEWDDLSITGAIFTSPGAAPKYRTNVKNGLPCVVFDAASLQHLLGDIELGDIITDAAFTLFVVMCVDTYNSTSTLPQSCEGPIIGYDVSGGLRWGVTLRATGPQIKGTNYDGTRDTAAMTGPAAGTWVIAELRHSGGNIYISINGGTETSAASGNATNLADFVYLGKTPSIPKYFSGKIAEIINAPSALSSGDRATIRDYLNKKWAIY